MTHGCLCHVEYNVTDIERSKDFYGALFGWDFRQFTDDMVVFGQGETHIGGLMKGEPDCGGSPSLWFKVDSLDETGAKAQQMGGKIAGEKGEVPGVGWSMLLHDPDGNSVGIVQYAN